MKKVLIFGSFDLIHAGHRDVFRQARCYGDCLYVVLARDETIQKIKGQMPLYSETVRKEMLEKEVGVDAVYLGGTEDKYTIINELRPQVIVLGYDQYHFTDKLEEKLQEFSIDCSLIRAEAYMPNVYKSSLLKKKL